MANSCRYGEYPLTSQIREFPPVLGRDATVLNTTAMLPKGRARPEFSYVKGRIKGVSYNEEQVKKKFLTEN